MFAVTGANGFLGKALVQHLSTKGAVRAVARTAGTEGQFVKVGGNEWPADIFSGCSTVYHAAGRAHVYDKSADEARLFDEANRALAVRVARAAIAAKAERFVFVSSLSVHGDHAERPITADSPARPTTQYGISKMQAEAELKALFAEAATRLVVVRPPMIYGPACPGNFTRLVRLVRKGLPLPFASVRAVRSFVHIDNLTDFLANLAIAPIRTGIYLAGDGSDFRLPDLIRVIASGVGARTALLPFPPSLLRLAGRAIGKERELSSLTRGMVVDWSPAREELGWQPPIPADQALAATVDWYRQNPDA